MVERCCIVVVHAHPDDETIHFGGTLARYAGAGARVVCVTATRGELGEIVDPALASQANRDRLGEIRMDEMARALARLGPIEARWLGYRDSGTPGSPHNSDAEAFAVADIDEAAGRVARVLREVRPQIVITHGADGGDGHPDHRQAARAATLAFERAGDPSAWPEQLEGGDGLTPWTPTKLYAYHSMSRVQPSRMTKLRWVIRDQGPVAAIPLIARTLPRLVSRGGSTDVTETTAAVAAAPRPGPDARIDVADWIAARDAAIRAYRTQIRPDDPLLELSPQMVRRMEPTENYSLVLGMRSPTVESDLASGILHEAAAVP
jgi:N-acetyl-1-D-myo-inositol-2-amino-2-deoxy-alpha-D-glucopyranoside deacetylase